MHLTDNFKNPHLQTLFTVSVNKKKEKKKKEKGETAKVIQASKNL